MKAVRIKLGGPIQWKLPPMGPQVLDVKLGPGRIVNPLIVHQSREDTSAYVMDDNLLRFSSDELYLTLEGREQEDYCAENREEIEADVAAFLGWVRELSFLHKIGPTAGVIRMNVVEELPEKIPFTPQSPDPRNMVVMQGDSLLNTVNESVARQAAKNVADRRLVPIHRVYLVSAYSAFVRDDYRQCFLDSAMAIESLMAGNLEHEFQRRRMGGEGLDLRFIETLDSDGKAVKKDPIYELLCLRNDLTTLLHERSLYLTNRSFLFDSPEMFRMARKLNFTRNRIVQRSEGAEENADRFFAMNAVDAALAIRCVAEIFKWSGEKRPVFPNNKMIPACVVRWDRELVPA